MAQKRVDDASTISASMVEDAERIFVEYLKRIGLKQTVQRQLILRAFLKTKEHLSVEELHHLAQKKDKKIGFTTVYRTLKLLSECGLASAVEFHDGKERYEPQYNRRTHHHMICSVCGESVEFFSQEIEKIEQKVGRQYRYKTSGHSFKIYGVCPKCRRRSEQEK